MKRKLTALILGVLLLLMVGMVGCSGESETSSNPTISRDELTNIIVDAFENDDGFKISYDSDDDTYILTIETTLDSQSIGLLSDSLCERSQEMVDTIFTCGYSSHFIINVINSSDDILLLSIKDGEVVHSEGESKQSKLPNEASSSASESISTVDWHEAGQYRVGNDIPAGEYYIKATDSEFKAYMCVSSDGNGDNILENENFLNNHYVTLTDGQYFEVKRGRFALASKVTLSIDTSNIPEGMYRVGIDIPAGEYKLENTNPDYKSYVCIYDNSSVERDIIDNDNFEGSKYYTVRDGNYLLLSRCKASLVA